MLSKVSQSLKVACFPYIYIYREREREREREGEGERYNDLIVGLSSEGTTARWERRR
jgi:hypothetical protein